MPVAHAVILHEIMGSIVLPILVSPFPRFELIRELFSLSLIDIHREHFDSCEPIHKASPPVRCPYDGAV
jgi:hypothetical protein